MFFNFNLLINEIFYMLPNLITYTLIWLFFLKNNSVLNKKFTKSNDKIYKGNSIKIISINTYINYILIILLQFLFNLFIYFGVNYTFWWNHLFINEFIYLIICIVTIVSIITIFLIKYYLNKNINKNIDFFFSLINIVIILPCIFLCFSLYTFYFIIEFIAISIFYKFSVSKFWIKQDINVGNNKNLGNFFSKNFLNVLFYQYWVNFFSSILIFFSILNLVNNIGTSDWIFLNLLNNISIEILNAHSLKNILILLIFLLGFLLKIGISPLHLFKIEVYKGIPFLSIYFYTTFYFFIYFLFFAILICFFINKLTNFIWFALCIILIFSVVYTLILLFDVMSIKSFFAYSTIVNSINFLILLLINV